MHNLVHMINLRSIFLVTFNSVGASESAWESPSSSIEFLKSLFPYLQICLFGEHWSISSENPLPLWDASQGVPILESESKRNTGIAIREILLTMVYEFGGAHVRSGFSIHWKETAAGNRETIEAIIVVVCEVENKRLEKTMKGQCQSTSRKNDHQSKPTVSIQGC